VLVHASIKAIACVYALLAVALVSHWVYAVLYIGTWGTSDLLFALGLLGLAHGLVTFRSWARTIGLVSSALFGVAGISSLIVWMLVHVFRWSSERMTGLIIDRPVAGLIIVALFIAFSAWQWWVLTRPQVGHLFSSEPV
jgi:hypothetical protein